MSVKIKICGVRTSEALDALIAEGADYFGLVFYPPSPRDIPVAEARALVERAGGRAEAVALLIDPDPQEAARIAREVAPAYLQLHGHESPDLVARIKDETGLPVIKAVRIDDAGDVERAQAYRSAADILLYDAKERADATARLPGGNGVPFDWRLLTGIKKQRRFMLSGGLTPDNVAAAINLTRAPMVDVSSGVERRRGEKDPELIARFIAAARAAPQLG